MKLSAVYRALSEGGEGDVEFAGATAGGTVGKEGGVDWAGFEGT